MPLYQNLSKTSANKLYEKIAFSNIGTRIFCGQFQGSSSNSSSTTYQITLALAQQFEAVRLIFCSNQYNAFQVNAVAASVIGSTSDLNNSSGTWITPATYVSPALSQPMIKPASPGSSGQGAAITYSDWIHISSIPRTDGGTYPLLVLRAIMGATSNSIPLYGNNANNFTNWATNPNGAIFAARSQVVDGITTPSNFTSTTNISGSPIVGVQYAAKGKVVTVAAFGDSITQGQGSTYINTGFNYPVCLNLSNPANIAVEYANLGWSGQSPQQFFNRALYLMRDLKPQILIIPSCSPNAPAVPLTASYFSDTAGYRQAVGALASELGIYVVMWTMLPVNTAVHAWGTSDSFRTADNAQLLAAYQNHPYMYIADLATAMSGATSGGQVQFNSAYTTDGVHPNDTGNPVCTALLQPIIGRILGLNN